MGGLNPNIILSIGQNAQQQQPPNLLGQYAQVQQIQANKMAMQAQQQNMMLAGIKQQSAQVELGQQQLAAKQQQQAVEALSNAGGDVDKATAQLLAVGNPQGLTLQKHRQEVMKQMADIQKTTADMQKAQAETQIDKLGHAAALMSGVLDEKPELQGQVYQARRALAIQSGLATSDDLPETWNDQTKQKLAGMQEAALTAKDKLQQRLDAAKAVEQARHNSAEEQLTQTRDVNTAQNQASNLAETSRYHNIEAKQRGQQIGIEGMNAQTSRARLQQEYGDAAGNVSPGNLKLAEKLSQGELDPSMLGRMPGKQGIMAAAMQMNPNWTPQLYQTKKDFKTGKSADDLTRLQTALEHAQRFADNSGKMGTLESLTSGANLTGNQRKMSLDANLLSGEVGRLVTGGVVPEGELHQIQSNLKSGSASVRKQAAEELMQLAAGKIEGLRKRYENGTGMKFDNSLLTPQAQALANSGAAAGSAASPGVTAAPGVPSVGGMFNGEKVLKVTRVK